MNTKIKSAIEKFMLNGATFKNEPVEPTLINFFYGNNGTGKSTIAKAISQDTEFGDDFTWTGGKSVKDYSLLVYNDEFVDKNLADYADLPGVFTVGEENIQIQKEVADKTAERAEKDKLTGEKVAELKGKETERGKLLTDFHDICWDKTKSIRDRFKPALSGIGTKASLATKILQGGKSSSHDEGELEALMQSAYAKSVEVYNEFKATCDTASLRGGNELLAKSITSSSGSEFAQFIKRINSIDWVRQGHEQFGEDAGEQCPYCQQELPPDFEDKLAACFDREYQNDIAALKNFHASYVNVMRNFISQLKANLQNPLPSLAKMPEFGEYETTLALLAETIEANILLIEGKLKEPSSVVEIKNIKPQRERMSEIMDILNVHIQANNALVDKKAKAAKQAECAEKAWELILHTVQSEVSSHHAKMKKVDGEIAIIQKLIADGKKASDDLSAEITTLSSKIINTTKAIENINTLLRDSGFQGFTLAEKKGHKGAYQLIRTKDSTVVKNRTLSEGERNFISFLYFCEMVKGGPDEDSVSNDKIVVIDDPVSSMDSGALFIVSTLVRNMLAECKKNKEWSSGQGAGSNIKQIFILTHNVYFHREVTYNQAKPDNFNHVSFYLINKEDNNSVVKPCLRENTSVAGGEMENYNPIQNSYAALWREFREVTTNLSIMSVTRRILEYYFLQLCGYEGADIREDVLVKNEAKFKVKVGDKVDATKYNLADSMLAYINAASVGVFDGFNYVESTATVDEYRTVLKMIFEAMEQEQHYNMMMSA